LAKNINFLTLQDFFNFFAYHSTTPWDFLQESFWIAFGLLFLLFSITYRKIALRNFILLVFSFFFYYKSSGFYFWLLIFSTLTDFYFALWIAKAQKRFTKNIFLFLSVLCNLGILAYYKYAYLLTNFLNRLLGTNWVAKDYLAELSNVLTGSNFEVSQIFLPVGISFYVFQTLSYTIDVYRGKISATRNLQDFALFVSFFPQLVAGPIVRATEFLPQIQEPYSVEKTEIGRAFWLIIAGMTKKILADYISLNWASRTFENPYTYSGFEHLLGVYGFALQIYFDFSGYTDIATGLALLLGFRLPLNFLKPYHSTNITEFWRRWHISLSSWLRDYLYISLGGNRKASFFTYLMLWVGIAIALLLDGLEPASLVFGGLSAIFWLLWIRKFKDFWGYAGLHILVVWAGFLYTQQALISFFSIVFVFLMWLSAIWSSSRRLTLSTDANLMLTMLLGGLWHGADLRFIVWGAMHGLALGVHKSWMPIAEKLALQKSKVWNFLSQILTFHFVCLAWIFFRANPIEVGNGKMISAFEVAQIILLKITKQFAWENAAEILVAYHKVFLVIVLAYFLYLFPAKWKSFLQEKFVQSPEWAKAVFISLWIIFFYYQVCSLQNQPFIYFQF
jgi:D-alanyl-lipoteichoic acid acyltransferase DltB (MBOAT superfamily)